MKIAILTFFESENYGTVLQAYATQKYLEIEGHTAELLHIKRMVNGKSSHYASVAQTPTLCERVRYKAVTLLKKKSMQEKAEKFKAFRKRNLQISKYYDSEEKLLSELEDYDLFVSGGDQIWNPYHKVFSSNYMFDFLPDEKPRISYGSSFGISEINDDLILSKMKADLSKYRAIGIREQSGVSIVNSMGLDAMQVLDPVFLLNNYWNDFVRERPQKRKYCLVYALIGYPEAEKKKIAEFAKSRGLEVVILPYNRQNSLNGFKKEFGLSPEEFLNHIANAEYVFTNSFHGLAFSILFQKQFTLLGCDSEEGLAKRERLIDLLEQFKIGDRNFENAHSVIDYNAVNKLMQSKVNESKKYMRESIDKIGVN
ncbi:MAG: polysaccharide pyruvyl transferase family protein [Ruminococcaceae bacterium]|nr:polysaccharide pyruvyl transferase family protein [Oscillospiraceae bacterium]